MNTTLNKPSAGSPDDKELNQDRSTQGFRLAIVIPAYNEAATIAKVVTSAKAFGHVIVANDLSTDKTLTAAQSAGATVVTTDVNSGYDGALERGFLAAKQMMFTHVITMDADGQHRSELLPLYIAELKTGQQLVVGNRDKVGRWSEYLFRLYGFVCFKIHDPLCGMKGYDLDFYARLGHFDSYKSTGTELMFWMLRQRCRFSEIPVPVIDRADKPRFGSTIKGNVRVLKSLWRSIKIFGLF